MRNAQPATKGLADLIKLLPTTAARHIGIIENALLHKLMKEILLVGIVNFVHHGEKNRSFLPRRKMRKLQLLVKMLQPNDLL
jgi:hypothetical protein